jgi:hypothetical protein
MSAVAPVFWETDLDSGTVVLGAAAGRPVASVLPANISTRFTVIRQSAEGLYGVCGDKQSRMQVVLLDGASIDCPLVFVIPHTADTQGRLNAVKRFLSLQRGRALPDSRVTPQRRQRFRQLLRTFDARSCGASYRDIAAALFGRHRISGPDWHESSHRYTIIRLVQDGVELVRGRYRDILRHRGKA